MGRGTFGRWCSIALAVLLCWQAAPQTAHAEETRPEARGGEDSSWPIPAWPLLYHRSEADHARTDILWPVLHYKRSGTYTRYAVRPFLFSHRSDPANGYRQTDVLWPLARFKQRGTTLTSRIAPVWWRRVADDRSYLHVWPLFGVSERADGLRERSTLFPFFRVAANPNTGMRDLHAPWPLARFYRRGETISQRVLPVYWREKKPDRSSGFVFPYFWSSSPKGEARGILPLWYRATGPELQTNMVFPFYYKRETPTHTRLFITPLWYRDRGTDKKTDLVFPFYYKYETPTHTRRFITPLWYRGTAPGKKTDMVFPFYFQYRSPLSRTRFITPLYWEQKQEKSTSRALLPIYFSHRAEDFGLTLGIPLYYSLTNGPRTHATLFPFYFRADNTEKKTAFRFYFPFYGSYRQGDQVSRHLLFFPLYATFQDKTLQLKSRDVLWPLFHYETSPGHVNLRALLYWRTRDPDFRRTAFLPFYWSQASERGDYTHLLPFYVSYGRKEQRSTADAGKAGQEGEIRYGQTDAFRRRLVLGPLYIHTMDAHAGRDSRSVLFPLYNRTTWKRENKKRAWLLPAYYHQSTPERHYTVASALLLPPYYLHEKREGLYRRHLWPLFGRTEKGTYRETSTLWPLVRIGRDAESGRSLTQALLFQRRYKPENNKTTTTVFPLWQRQESPGRVRDASLLLHWYERNEAKKTVEASFLWLFPPEVSLAHYHRREQRVSHGIFPLYHYSKDDKADETRWSVLGPVLTHHRRGDAVRDTRFLWRVVSYERQDTNSEFRFLYRLIYRSRTADSSIFELNPLFSLERTPTYVRWQILGGLLGHQNNTHGRDDLRLLWVF